MVGQCFLDGVLEGGGGDEADGLGGLDLDGDLGLGIAPHAGLARDGLEGAEADELNGLFFQTSGDGLEDGIEGFCRSAFGGVSTKDFLNCVDELGFVHGRVRFGVGLKASPFQSECGAAFLWR
jgi:hypothetical protein